MSSTDLPWDQPTAGAVTRYGFQWGPMIVTRLAHIDGRGYSLAIETPHQAMQVYVSEKGRKIAAMPVRQPPLRVDADEPSDVPPRGRNER